MDIESYVQAIVQHEQTCNGHKYMRAVASVESALKLVHRDNAEMLGKIKDEIVKLKTKYDRPGNICKKCKIDLQNLYGDGELICPQCGYISGERDDSCMLTSGIFEPRKPQFNPNNHFTEWLNQILGLASPKDWDVINTIRQYIAQNNIHEISPESLRKILKDLKLSKYYKYTSFLFKELTGIGPPNIPKVFIRRANFLFDDYIRTRQKIRGENSSWGPNNPPYPYLIYKIFNVILPADDETRRIFHFIKLPGAATLKKRDEEWDIVWKQIEQIK